MVEIATGNNSYVITQHLSPINWGLTSGYQYPELWGLAPHPPSLPYLTRIRKNTSAKLSTLHRTVWLYRQHTVALATVFVNEREYMKLN